jgi:hypothetical protein
MPNGGAPCPAGMTKVNVGTDLEQCVYVTGGMVVPPVPLPPGSIPPPGSLLPDYATPPKVFGVEKTTSNLKWIVLGALGIVTVGGLIAILK